MKPKYGDVRNKTRINLWIGAAIVLLAHLPFFILGESSYITIHDNLDSDFIYLHLLKLSNNLFSGDSGIMTNVLK